jgi:5'-deoxynucleotidase YfbR-like HD superfamily hydrolase
MSNLQTDCTLETVTGKIVDLENPDPETINITDIAWSLSRAARFTGHTIQPIPYNNGQHSINVAKEAVREARRVGHDAPYLMGLYGLVHDGNETYTGDVAGPLKKIPELRAVLKPIENRIQSAIYQALDLPEPTDADEHLIKKADLLCQRMEGYNFMYSRGSRWEGLPDVGLLQLHAFEEPLGSVEVFKQFLELYEELHQLNNNPEILPKTKHVYKW